MTKYFHLYASTILFKKVDNVIYGFSRNQSDPNKFTWKRYPIMSRKVSKGYSTTIEKFLKLDKVKRRMKHNKIYERDYKSLLKESFYLDLLKDSDDV